MPKVASTVEVANAVALESRTWFVTTCRLIKGYGIFERLDLASGAALC